MRQTIRFALLLATSLPLAACSGSEDLDPAETGTDASDETGGDEGMPPGDDMPAPRVCLVGEDLGDLGAIEDAVATVEAQEPDDPESPLALRLGIELDEGPLVDILSIDLYDAAGAFEEGLAPGTYSLGGLEADFAECGACVYITGDTDLEADTVEQQFQANGGSITIEAADTTPGGTFRGSLANVTMREVLIDLRGQTEVPDGCTISIDALTFEATVEAAE